MTKQKPLKIAQPVATPPAPCLFLVPEKPDWVELFKTHRQILRIVLRRKGVLHCDLDDAEQDVFLRLVKTYDRIRALEALAGYLRTLAADVARGYRRRYAAFVFIDPMILADTRPCADEATAPVSVAWMLSLVADADLRRILELRFVQGYSRNQIAELLHLTPRAVKYKQAHALAILRAGYLRMLPEVA